MMGWSLGYDDDWHRDIGYSVPAYCDHPGCMAEIDRGLSYVCGGEAYGGDTGCGLYFCGKHLGCGPQTCERCEAGDRPFEPTPDHPTWVQHKLTDASWQQWRDENPDEVKAMNKSDLPLDKAQAVASVFRESGIEVTPEQVTETAHEALRKIRDSMRAAGFECPDSDDEFMKVISERLRHGR